MSKIVEYKEFECQYCKISFEKPLRYVKSEENKGKEIKYCSRECSCNARKKRIEVICNECGNMFEKLPKKIGNNNFCCKNCLDSYNLSNKMKFECLNCENEFYIDNSYIESQQLRDQSIVFCSRSCKHEYQRKDMKEVTCSYCENNNLKSINKIGELNFCNIECKNSYHKKFNNKEVRCKHCKKDFIINSYKVDIQNRQFCDWNCKTKYFGIIYDNYKKIAHYLRTTVEYEKWRIEVLLHYENKCSECNSEENLQAHHLVTLFNISKQYNFDNQKIKDSEEFNDISNGICLCQACHHKKHSFMKQKQYISNAVLV